MPIKLTCGQPVINQIDVACRVTPEDRMVIVREDIRGDGELARALNFKIYPNPKTVHTGDPFYDVVLSAADVVDLIAALQRML